MHLNTKEKGSMSKEQESEERERNEKIILIFFFFEYWNKVIMQLKQHIMKIKIDLTFQTPSAKPPKLRAMKSNLGPRRSTLPSL